MHFTHEKNGWGLRKGSVAELMRKARWYLERDIPLTVFPEGGRSLDGIPRPFKDGFFKLAIDTQADIQVQPFYLVTYTVGGASRRGWDLDG